MNHKIGRKWNGGEVERGKGRKGNEREVKERYKGGGREGRGNDERDEVPTQYCWRRGYTIGIKGTSPI